MLDGYRFLLLKHINFDLKLQVIQAMNVIIRPSSDGTYYGMVMSVRPGLRPAVFRTFLLHPLTYGAEILHMTLF